MIINSLKKYFANPYRGFALLGSKGKLKFIPDELYLKLVFRGRNVKKLDLKNPKTYNEKLQWLKLHDKRSEYTVMVDKLRKGIHKIYNRERYLIPLLGVFNNYTEIILVLCLINLFEA